MDICKSCGAETENNESETIKCEGCYYKSGYKIYKDEVKRLTAELTEKAYKIGRRAL